jgi:dienelactone hydrolase
MRLLIALLMALVMTSALRAQETIEDGYLLPVTIGGQLFRLEAYSARLRSAGTQALPLVIISHGTDPDVRDNKLTRASNYRLIARDFARRGWHAVAITRRGFGVSEGQIPRAGSCSAHRIDLVFDAYAIDLLAATDVLATQRGVDASRVLYIGVSTGGLSSLLAAGRRTAGKTFAINVAGGWRSSSCEWEGQVNGIFAAAAKASAQRGGVPSAWFYAENDSFFGPNIVEKFLAAYRGAGGNAKFTRYPATGEDGHNIFSDWRGREKWLPEVDQFLAANGLPHLTPQAIDALIESAKLGPNVKPLLERYFRLPGEKALAITNDNRRLFWRFGSRDSDEARTRALEDCNKAQAGCKALFVNNVVVR